MEMKKYVDIVRLKETYASAFSKGEHVVVSEKIDGANASLCCGDGKILAFSRRQQLTPENNLRGFYEFAQSLSYDELFAAIGSRYIVFGEWLVKHSVAYPEERLNQFYVFDVWDTEIEQYMPWTFTKEIADKLGLNTVPIFYDGEFTSWDDIAKLVGKTEMGASPEGEGVVVKSQDRLDNRSSKTPPYVKIVSERFSEVQKSSKPKEIDPEVLAARQAAEELAATIVTERRVGKILEKMVDEGILPEDWDEHDMKTVSKNLPKACYEDCKKEESEVVAQIENFGKICGSLAMRHARALLK